MRGIKKYRIALLTTFVMLAGYDTHAQQVEKVSPNGTKFLLYTPPGYTPNDQHPLLIVLHGQGAMGDDLNKLKKRDQTPSMLIAQNKWPSRYPFIIVSPQLKRDESVPRAADQKWPPEMVNEVVEYVRSQYSVDGRRIYITGLSQGGHGSYDYMVAYPDKIAAAVLISGVPDSTVACAVKDIPLWIFHGTDDPLVPNVFATGLMRALNACTPRGKFSPHLNMLYGHKHEGWNEIYNGSNGYAVFDWMLKFRKNDPSNTPPHTSAGSDITIAHRDQPVHLYGEVFDSDGTVAQVSWTKIRGPSVTMDDVHSTMLRLSNFVPGDYQFKLTATDNDGGRSEDIVNLKIVPSPGGLAVTQLSLMDGEYQTVGTLREGYIVNAQSLSEINVRASVTGSVGSVQFTINSNGNARTTNEAPYVVADPRWTVTEDEYRICATPYSGRNAVGTQGVTLCYNVVVSASAASPEDPQEPEQPEEPEQPQEPEQPGDGDHEEPQEPEQPEEPEQPQEPEQPGDSEPDQPDDPEQPQEPGPDNPEQPQEPQQPEVPEVPTPPADTVSVPIPDDVITWVGETLADEVIIYPNPARDYLHVQLLNPVVSDGYYVIISTMGNETVVGQLAPLGPANEIDIRALPPGVYILKIQQAHYRLETRFVVDGRGP